MIMLRKIALLGALILGPACQGGHETNSTPDANGGSVGSYKGFNAINQYIKDRLIIPESTVSNVGPTGFPVFRQPFSLEKYLNFDTGLSTLLGVYASSGGVTIFENSKPNAMNVALWKLVLDHLAQDIALVCAPAPATSSLSLRDDFVAKVKVICQWPAAPAKDQAALQNVWVAVMGYQAPEAEFTAWSQWFTGQSVYAQMNGQDVVQAMVWSIMMNPYYLLSH